MLARLTVHFPFKPTRSFLIQGDTETTIGRDSDCTVVLEDDRVSRRHACIRYSGGLWHLSDLGSTNGTSIQGNPIEHAALGEDDWLSFGGLLARFQPSTPERERSDSRHREERFRSSISMQRQLDPMLGVERLLESLLGSVLTLSATERGVVLLQDASGGMSVAARRNLGDPELLSDGFSGSVGAIQRVMSSSKPVAVSDAQADTFLGNRESVVLGGIRALVCIPLVALDRLTGVIYADSPSPGTSFGDLDVEILEALASHAALAIVMARMHEELKGLASRLPEVRSGSSTSWAGILAHHGAKGGQRT